MGLVFEQVFTEGIAQFSYLVGDDAAGVAAVIDPRRDVAVYLELARERGLRIVHAIETHVHADYVSGARELVARTGATIHGGPDGGYAYEVHELREGAELRLGTVRLRALHTPGHTPEHVCLLLHDEGQGEEPFAVFTGDTLLNLDVGRPDLRGEAAAEEFARRLHRSLFGKLLPLGDRVEVYPAHGAGSACAKVIGDRRWSTIGNERLFSPALRERGEEAFVRWLLDDLPEPPRHYARLKEVNARGAEVRGGVPVLPPLPLEEFRKRTREHGAIVVDVRSVLAFGGGHVARALNIGLDGDFPTWIGSLVDPGRPLLLVLDGESQVRRVAEHLFRLGLDGDHGYLQGGMTAWQNAALPLARTGEWTVQELNDRKGETGVTVLDVRGDPEWEDGHVPGAKHVPLAQLEERLGELDREGTVAAYCGTGYRASIAASLLQKRGFASVVNVPGSMTAWRAAGLPLAAPAPPSRPAGFR